MTARRIQCRRGIALVAALALMTVLGLLVVGAVGSVVAAQRSTELARVDAALDAAADYGVGTVLADPRGYGLADLALGRAQSYSIPLVEGGTAAVTATRLPGGIVWFVAALGAGGPRGSRRSRHVGCSRLQRRHRDRCRLCRPIAVRRCDRRTRFIDVARI